ncbi:hypothetical protein VPHF99_0203 [Vibrio phage F99]|nr:hypothetical protein MYOV085v1_p0208 [Vibrio phage 355E48.1]
MLKPSEFYILHLHNKEDEYYKIGITNNFKERFRVLTNSTNLSIIPVVRYLYDTGHIPASVEKELKLKYSKEMGVSSEIIRSGFTECFVRDDNMLHTVKNHIHDASNFTEVLIVSK